MYSNSFYRYPVRQNQNNNRYITVDGFYIQQLIPDTFLVKVSLSSYADTTFEAVTNNNNLYDQTAKGIKEFGIKEEDIILDNTSVTPIFEDGTNITSYKATTTFTIRVYNFQTVLEALSSPGDLNFEGITFTLTNPEEHYQQVLNRATENGIRKAKEIADAIGVSIDPIPLSIKEITDLDQLIERVTSSIPGEISTLKEGFVYIEAKVQEVFKIHTPM
ncbi:SIMPL domain-containing protein [Vallitalea okinawensis]|uniref:SIMPL domain-containing protein n=1 Tax=Vallitalea okinawensis TaxID=2078660 RepID=UPI000CFC452F|nr:SIMPL domain-containing protein [Vallitalea okinawensis]